MLGLALIDAPACATLVSLLRPEHFADHANAHPRIFEAIGQLMTAGTPVDLVTVSEALRTPSRSFSPYITELSTAAGRAAGNAEHYARILQEKWVARHTHRSALAFAQRLTKGDDVFDALNAHQREITGLQLGHGSSTHVSHFVESAFTRMEDWQKGRATDLHPTGFRSLDLGIGGFPVGELTTLAAMTGAGKTSLLGQMMRTLAFNQSKQDRPEAVLIFSAEMNGEQIVHRLASSWSGLNLRHLRRGKEPDPIYERYSEALRRLAMLPLHIDDTASPTFPHIHARCMQLRMQHGLAFVGVDYDEKIYSEGATEELRVARIAEGLKDLAKGVQVPVVALSQYSRKANAYQIPDNSWLRYSGKKEQESAVIVHWVWPRYWKDKGIAVRNKEGHIQIAGWRDDRPDDGFLLVTKNRFGPQGRYPLAFNPKTTTFTDPEEEREEARGGSLFNQPALTEEEAPF